MARGWNSKRAVADRYQRAGLQNRDFVVTLANGVVLDRVCGSDAADACKEANRLAARQKTTVVSVVARTWLNLTA